MSDAPEKPRPWYGNGLRFRCTQCGNCCTGDPGGVWVDDADVAAIADYLNKSVGEVRLLYTRPLSGRTSLREFPNGDCTFLDSQTNKCMIYPVRPTQCRTWPFWRSNIESPEAWQKTRQVCPGAGCGELVSLELIERLACETDR